MSELYIFSPIERCVIGSTMLIWRSSDPIRLQKDAHFFGDSVIFFGFQGITGFCQTTFFIRIIDFGIKLQLPKLLGERWGRFSGIISITYGKIILFSLDPDKVPSRVLKKCMLALANLLLLIFNKFLSTGQISRLNGKVPMLLQYQNQVINGTLLTTDQSQ